MNAKRAAALVVVGGALAVWLASAATSGNRVRVDPIAVGTPALDAHYDRLTTEIAKLHEHLRPGVAPRQPGRNLFAFASRPAPAPVAPPAASRPALVERPARVELPPALKLVGIAEDAGSGAGVTRTAILSGAGQLFLVKEGDNATARYRVLRISADVVELSDLTQDTVLRLALK